MIVGLCDILEAVVLLLSWLCLVKGTVVIHSLLLLHIIIYICIFILFDCVC